MNDNNIDTFYLLDLDRTLFNTEKAMVVMRGVVDTHSTELAAAMTQRFEEFTITGESFSVRDFILERVGEEEMQGIEAAYREASLKQDLLNPGAVELIEYIRQKPRAELGILTYGSPLGQAMKIAGAAGLESIRFMVTDETHKGALIATWRREDGQYVLPAQMGGYVAKHIVFVDDKPFSFTGLPIDVTGYLVQTDNVAKETTPPHITSIETLADIITTEKIDKA